MYTRKEKETAIELYLKNNGIGNRQKRTIQKRKMYNLR